MPIPAFHDWLEHRVPEVPDAGTLALVIGYRQQTASLACPSRLNSWVSSNTHLEG